MCWRWASLLDGRKRLCGNNIAKRKKCEGEMVNLALGCVGHYMCLLRLSEEGEDDLDLFCGYEQVRWTCEPSPEQYPLFGKWRRVRGREFFAPFDLIQRCSVPFQGCRWLGGRRGRVYLNGFRGRSVTFGDIALSRQSSSKLDSALDFRNVC